MHGSSARAPTRWDVKNRIENGVKGMRSTRLFAFAALMALPLGTTTAVAAPATPGVAKAGSGVEHRSVIQVQNRGSGRSGGGAAMRGGGGPGGSAMRGGRPGGGGPGMRAGRSGGGPALRGSGGGQRAAMRGGGRWANSGGNRGGPGFRGRGSGKGYANYRGRHHGHRHRFRGGRYFYGYPYFYNYGPAYYDDYYYDDGGYNDTVYDDGGTVYADDDVARCAARYRSFDPATGTFLHNDGRRKLCPYLAS